jgi:hypothetical protein
VTRWWDWLCAGIADWWTWIRPVGVPVAATIITQLIFGPAFAARRAQKQALYESRQRVADDLTRVMLLCSFLEPKGSLRPGGMNERKRWTSQLDEVTARLADTGPVVALTHPRVLGFPVLVSQNFGIVRGVWISDRTLVRRIAELKEAAEPLHAFYGRRLWHKGLAIVRMKASRDRWLTATCARRV